MATRDNQRLLIYSADYSKQLKEPRRAAITCVFILHSKGYGREQKRGIAIFGFGNMYRKYYDT